MTGQEASTRRQVSSTYICITREVDTKLERQNFGCVGRRGSGEDTPFEAQKNLTDQEYWLVWSKEDNEEEAAHDTQGAEHNPFRAESRDEPTIDDSTHDGTDTTSLAKPRLPASSERVPRRSLLGLRHGVAELALEGWVGTKGISGQVLEGYPDIGCVLEVPK